MNLQSQITEIRRRIAEPYPDDQSDANITDDEIVDWLYQAELQVARDANDAAFSYNPSQLVYTATIASGTSPLTVFSASTPAMFRLLGVAKYRNSALPPRTARIVSFNDFQRAQYDPNWRSNDSHPIACLHDGLLNIHPDRTSGSVNVTYISIPQRRYRRFRGSVTSKTTNLIWVDSKLVTAGYPDDYFNVHGFITSGVKYTSGEPNGRIVEVSDYVGATGTVTTAATGWSVANEAFAPDINVGDTYEIGEKSQFADIFAGPIYAYVAYLCFCKGNDEQAQKCLDDYQRQIGQINAVSAEGGVRQ